MFTTFVKILRLINRCVGCFNFSYFLLSAGHVNIFFTINFKFNIMNIVVINASPRKRGNTAELCKNVVEGAENNDADVIY